MGIAGFSSPAVKGSKGEQGLRGLDGRDGTPGRDAVGVPGLRGERVKDFFYANIELNNELSYLLNRVNLV